MAESTRSVVSDVENPTQKKEAGKKLEAVLRPSCLSELPKIKWFRRPLKSVTTVGASWFRRPLKSVTTVGASWFRRPLKSGTTVGASPLTDDPNNIPSSSTRSTSKWSTFMEICDPRGQYVRVWKIIFVISCVFAVSLDPLFFYILIVDQDKKCLQIDRVLSFSALLLRSITDAIFLVHLIIGIYVGVTTQRTRKSKHLASKTLSSISFKAQTNGRSSSRKLILRDQSAQVAEKIAQKISWLSHSIMIDFLAILPIPQIVTFNNMRGSGYLEHKKVLNFLLLGQYIPRIFRIHVYANQLTYTTGIGVKALFNFFLYILASYVLGAFWYFFSIQRETSCWYLACVNHSRDRVDCINTFYCNSRPTPSRNITFLNEHCPLDTPENESPPFNFGIFLDSLKNQNTEHIKFGKKFFYSFWWGLRNLSNFGTNLTTSTYVWENLFAILISIVGLLLFLYLIGNVQTFMQMETTKSEETRQRMAIKKLDVRNWIARNGLPHGMKNEILRGVEKHLKRNKSADVENLFTILPRPIRKSVKKHLCLPTLKRVPLLKPMNIMVLEMLCEYMKQVIYNENSFVFRMGEPLDCMLIIIEGTIWTYSSLPPPPLLHPESASSSIPSTSDGNKTINEAAEIGKPKELTTSPSMATRSLGKGDFYGEELLLWASPTFPHLPTSHQYVKTQTKVEVLALMARDLATVISKCQLQWEVAKNVDNPQQVEAVVLSAIRRLRDNSRRPSTRRQ